MISWSGPATAFGGVFVLVAQLSHEVSFLHERSNITANKKISAGIFNIDFMLLF